MDGIELPFVGATSPRIIVGERLHVAKVGGVVVKFPDALKLTFVSNVFDSDAPLMSDLPESSFLSLGTPPIQTVDEFHAGGLLFTGGPPSPPEEQRWGLVGMKYAAFPFSHDIAMLVTRHESDAYEFGMLLVCEADPTHCFPRPRLIAGALCPKKHPGWSGAPPRVRRP